MPKITHPEEFALSNGIPVLLQDYDAPVAAIYWWNRVGSCDEGPKEAGFAHFLEHMLFKDAAAKETGRPSSGQMARAIESLGGDINAYTSFDQTVYHVTCAAQHWDKAMNVFGRMAKPQRFLKSDFEREREVILEELRKNEDSPDRQHFQALFSGTFSKHPYGKPVIGYTKTLKAAKVQDLEAFYRRSYVPENMGLIVVGPVGSADSAGGKSRRKSILRTLEKFYGSSVIPRRAGKRLPRVREPELRASAHVVAKPFDVKAPAFNLAFRVPSLSHEDIAALDMMANTLSMGEMGRLYQRLFYEKSLVTEVSGGLYVPKDPGMLFFQAELQDSEKIPMAFEELLAEAGRIREQGPKQEELERIIVNTESERYYSTQTADSLAGRLGFLKFIIGDLDYDRKYIDQLRALEAKDIENVAKKYLDPRRMAAAFLLPKDQAKVFDTRAILKIASDLLEPAPRAVASTKAAPGVAAPETWTRPSGMKVVYLERPDSHLFSIHAAALGGLRLEMGAPVESAEKDWGSSYMMSLTWTKGTPHHDARQIARIAEGKAAGIDGFSGRNSVGVQCTGLQRDWGSLSDLFVEVLTEPAFPEEEVAHSKRVAEESIRGIDDHSAQLCTKLFLQTLFERHPYRNLVTGSLESLASINSRKLGAFHSAWVRPERLVLSVAGAVKRDALEKALDQIEDGFAKAGAKPHGKPSAGLKIEDEPSLKAPRWVERHLGREQLHILMGGLGTRIDAEDRFALRVLQNVLGGQSGRLFIELREKKSLAYTVAPVSFEGIERGYVGTYIACSPAKRDEALAGIRAVLEKLAAKGPDPSEMARAKEYLLGRRAMDTQSDSSIAAGYGLEVMYGLPVMTQELMTRRIHAVTAKEVQEACKRYLVGPHQVTSVVG